MANAGLVDEINSRAQDALAELEERDVRPFTVAAVELDTSGALHNDVPFTRAATRSFLSVLRVKEDFPRLGEAVEKQKWAQALRVIQDCRRDQELFALYGKEPSGELAVQEVYPRNPKHAATALQHRSVLAAITGALRDSNREFSLKEMSFNAKTSAFGLTLLDAAGVNVGQGDVWRPGAQFAFSDMTFDHMPFFERLSCSNGMATRQHGFRSRVDQRRHNITKAAEVVRHSLVEGDDAMVDLVRGAVGALRVRNASIAELEWMRAAFKKALKEDEELFQRLDARYFDDSHLYRAYGTALEDCSLRWKQSADSGVVAYDLFNLMTWLASHPRETGVDEGRPALDIRIAAANLLFKMPLDLQDVAPRVDVPQHRIPEMQ